MLSVCNGSCPSPVLQGEPMATFRKRNDKWQARVQRPGQTSIAKSFNSKADAVSGRATLNFNLIWEP